jgi:hypothetical protein
VRSSPSVSERKKRKNVLRVGYEPTPHRWNTECSTFQVTGAPSVSERVRGCCQEQLQALDGPGGCVACESTGPARHLAVECVQLRQLLLTQLRLAVGSGAWWRLVGVGRCSVRWKTLPLRGPRRVQLTMSCSNSALWATMLITSCIFMCGLRQEHVEITASKGHQVLVEGLACAA